MAMGFSLTAFFSDLEQLLASEMGPEAKLAALEKLISNNAKKYARECDWRDAAATFKERTR